MYTTCKQKNLPTKHRHNEYGSCMEGLSAAVKNNTIITGVIGAIKWTGGVFAKRGDPDDIFGSVVEKYTMANQENGIRTMLTAHDYLGYSVDIGRFGFWYENGQKNTIVSGATRFGQHGAVVFLPFIQDSDDQLTFNEDKFVLNGTKMGSAFGYSIKAVDLNADGFDDLVVGAPFEHRSDSDGHFGGVVYVFFSQGTQREKHQSDKVFFEPIVLKNPGYYSQFGLSITSLGNVDGDNNNYQDFAVGAPFANEGVGAVYVYLGDANIKKFKKKPAQVIKGSDLPGLNGLKMKSFGFSLSGAIDMDDNGYPDLLIGAPLVDSAVLFRARPVISIKVSHTISKKMIDIERGEKCPYRSNTCFPLTMEILVDKNNQTNLIDLNNNDGFMCNLEAHDEAAKDWINPLKFKFTVSIRNEQKPSLPAEGRNIVDLKMYPILNKYTANYEFTVPFNTRCGDDQVCQTDLILQANFVDIQRTEKGFIRNVGEKDYLDIAFNVVNKKEKAYRASLYVTYDAEELELPSIQGGNQKLTLETIGKNVAHVILGNPLDPDQEKKFNIRFKLVRGRTEGIGRPLKFKAIANSTSVETNEADNTWEEEVQIIKRAELELIGTSDPAVIHFSGAPKGLAVMELEEDLGVMIRHNYTVHNKGPWTVRNVVAKIDWPYEIMSKFGFKGKWALYLLDIPTITTHYIDGTMDVRRCHVEQEIEQVNPLDIKLNTRYRTHLTEPVKRHNVKRARSKRDVEPEAQPQSSGEVSSASFFSSRISPHKKDENGQQIDVVTISCTEKTARCFTVACYFDFIDANSAPVIDFRARLWNSSFTGDYNDVEYVEIASHGRLEVDASQGIEDDPTNNVAQATTIAYPDRPAIGEPRPAPWWLYLISVLIGLLILAILAYILYKCGFFKRKRVDEPSLYTAELKHEREQWAQSQM
ncbi:hypothetical protein WR25_08553 [Diploscapter pachys]|uniref:Uncharacterized protein n=1 Tax=Diploscapter pachys TaxID=2018661 RepID=A0A2A2L5Z2_9BILA|nr:hypothetical protein WR25_08553 [Diploscapter pachys]